MPKKEIPIFLFNGFLDSGKTKLSKEILESDELYHDGKTLVILTEEGLEEYDPDFVNTYKINVAVCDDEEKFTEDYVNDLVKKYKPKQIFMELNAFFNGEVPIPKAGVVYQKVTLFDASKFGMYLNNMRQMINAMVNNSTIIIFNRCDNNTKDLGSYRRVIRAFNQYAQIGFEYADGKVRTQLDEDLPYDINASEIVLKDEDYPTWYMDIFDNFAKYEGKKITYRAFVRDVTPSTLVVGRKIMTCCEADIAFYGYEVITDEIIANNSYIEVTGHPVMHYSDITKKEEMMIEAENIKVLRPQIEKYLVFN